MENAETNVVHCSPNQTISLHLRSFTANKNFTTVQQITRHNKVYTPNCYCTSLNITTTTWGWVLLENLIVPPILEEFPEIYGTGRFITVFTTAHHWSLSWVRWIHSTTYHTISSKSILVYQNVAQWDSFMYYTKNKMTPKLYFQPMSRSFIGSPPTNTEYEILRVKLTYFVLTNIHNRNI